MFDFWNDRMMPTLYGEILPRVVGCKRCGKKFNLRKRQMWFHCGAMVILLVKESLELQEKMNND